MSNFGGGRELVPWTEWPEATTNRRRQANLHRTGGRFAFRVTAGTTVKARIALISADAGRRDARSPFPHHGLTLLATALSQAGYEARVFDQSYLQVRDDRFLRMLARFEPTLVGVALYTTYVRRILRLVEGVRAALPACPVIAGGPHVSLYAESMSEDPTFAALAKGEADCRIVEIVERVLGGERPGIVSCEPPSGLEIGRTDWRLAEGYQRAQWLPIQLSRGCPFNCSFCEVRSVASRKIRYRDVAACLDELEAHLRLLPSVHTFRIVDDCPTLDRPRFKGFLKDYLRRGLRARIQLDNLRADTVDEELVELLKQCRTPSICLGVESGNPEVFRLVDKGETLEEIRRAAKIVRQMGVPLYLCFVVGLPGSTFEAEMDSLRLAKALKPELIYWNTYLPHRGTRGREWYAAHGTIYDEWDANSLPDYNLRFTLPPAETPTFPRDQRVRAWLRCVIETGSFLMLPQNILRAVYLSARFGLWGSILPMLAMIPQKGFMYAKILLFRWQWMARLNLRQRAA